MRAGTPLSPRDHLPPSSRYELLVKIASGGMATVYAARLIGAVGFTRVVAVKRAHAHLAERPAFRKMFIAEAKLASRIHHPNVVSVLDVEELDGEVLLIMEYIEGLSLHDLAASPAALSARLAVRIVVDACAGLHAAHELKDDEGRPLGLVHRDVSPQNILVGIDGLARITDFGCAKAIESGDPSQTLTGGLKGKCSYMAPEYIERGELDARSDVFAMGVVAWETLTGKRLFRGGTDIETLDAVRHARIEPPSRVAPGLDPRFDDVVMTALARSPDARFPTGGAFGEALEQAAARCGELASAAEIRRHIRASAEQTIERRRDLIRETTRETIPPPATTGDVREEAASEPSRTLTLSIAGRKPVRPARAADEADSEVPSGPAPNGGVLPPQGKRSARWFVYVPLAVAAVGLASLALLHRAPTSPSGIAPKVEACAAQPMPSLPPSPPGDDTAAETHETAAPSAAASSVAVRARPPPATHSKPANILTTARSGPRPPPSSSARGTQPDRAPPNPYATAE